MSVCLVRCNQGVLSGHNHNPLVVGVFTAECQELHVFTDCRSIPLTYTLSDASVFRVVKGKGTVEITRSSNYIILFWSGGFIGRQHDTRRGKE